MRPPSPSSRSLAPHFALCGADAYYLLTRAADASLRALVLQTLDDAQSMNLKVLRIWAFCDGAQEWNSLQYAPNTYSDATFEGLDFILTEALNRGLQLILCMTNYFDAFGGVSQYVEWAGGTREDKVQCSTTRLRTCALFSIGSTNDLTWHRVPSLTVSPAPKTIHDHSNKHRTRLKIERVFFGRPVSPVVLTVPDGRALAGQLDRRAAL